MLKLTPPTRSKFAICGTKASCVAATIVGMPAWIEVHSHSSALPRASDSERRSHIAGAAFGGTRATKRLSPSATQIAPSFSAVRIAAGIEPQCAFTFAAARSPARPMRA